MRTRWSAFNIYLLAAAILVGCKSPGEKLDSSEARRQKKELTAIRFYLEAGGGDPSRAQAVPILRANPSLVKVEREPFLDERDVARASLSEHLGGFVIQIEFNEHGTLLLDSVSTANKGKRIAIQANFGEIRWLAAPVMPGRISGGVLTFTPDATQEESARIVRGLNNTAELIRKRERFLPSWSND